jgi:hypothetical protein
MRIISRKINGPEAALILIGAALFLYILVRAFWVSFTHDEGLTVMEYATQPWGTINDVNWTNNHLLNSWLCRLNNDWFSPSHIAFRWPNVLSGLLYIVFGALLLKKIFSGTWTCVFAFLVLLCNTFLIDFFGLCRGYGLSMGLLVTGLYFFYRYFETGKILIYGGIAITLFGLAMIANYTLLNFFLLFTGFFMLHALLLLIKEKTSRIKKLFDIASWLFIGIMAFFFIAWFVRMMLKMREVGNFNFGGEEGFWKNTVHSLIEFSSGPIVSRAGLFYVVLTWLALGLFIGAGVIIVARLRKQKFTPLNWFSVFLFAVLFGCGSAIWLQHLLMNVPFSSDRAGLYFYALFPLLVMICFFTPGNFVRLRRLLAGFFLAFPVISFFLTLNLDRTMLWPFNAHMQEATQKIIEDSRSKIQQGQPVRVAVSFLEYPVYNYYLYAAKNTGLNYMAYGETDYQPGADYFLYLDENNLVPLPVYKSIWEIPGLHVYRNTEPRKYRELNHLPQLNFDKEDGRPKAEGRSLPYAELINNQLIYSMGITDTLTDDTLRAGTIVRCEAYIWPDKMPVRSKLCVNYTSANEPYWKAIYLSWLMHDEKKWNKVSFDYTLPKDLFPGDKIVVYFMNDSDVDVRVDDFSVHFLVPIPN